MRDWLPDGDLADFIIDLVKSLDLSDIYRYYDEVPENKKSKRKRRKARSGQPAYHPEMMTTLLLYAYCNGTPSSRKIAKLCERDAGYRVATLRSRYEARVVAANQQPNFRTISEFRRIHLNALNGLFVQVLRLAQKAELVKLGHVALDGTKVKANASKHKAMSYARMVAKEEDLARQVEELLKRAEEVDTLEDGLYGPDKRGDELPEELRFRETRLKKIREAKRALEEEAKERARAEGKLDDEDNPKPPKRGRRPKTPSGTPKPKAQRNFTDPESRIMKMGNKSFDQAYNCQAAVDSTAQIIVACKATNASNDKQQLEPMTEQIEENLKAKPKKLSADAGYYSEENVEHLRTEEIDDYICPNRLKHSDEQPAVRGRIPRELSFIDRIRRKLRTKKGRVTYGLRKQIVEPVFGQMKQGRALRQFLLRGLEKVDAEWSLWCTTHNLLKIWAASN